MRPVRAQEAFEQVAIIALALLIVEIISRALADCNSSSHNALRFRLELARPLHIRHGCPTVGSKISEFVLFTHSLRQWAGLGGIFNVTAPVTFRIYGYAAEGAAGSYRLGIDAGSANAGLQNNLELQGDLTAVPEPTSLLLLGIGVAALLTKARHRLKSRA